jgi:hypothetical protein
MEVSDFMRLTAPAPYSIGCLNSKGFDGYTETLGATRLDAPRCLSWKGLMATRRRPGPYLGAAPQTRPAAVDTMADGAARRLRPTTRLRSTHVPLDRAVHPKRGKRE